MELLEWRRLSEEGVEGEEAGEGVGAVAFHGAEHSVEAFFCAYVSGFGVEFISVTY